MPLNIRDLASECGVSQRDLLALSPDNDPFALHRPARLQKAEWFADAWKALGFGFGTHIRRIHYRLVSTAEPLLLPDGTAYRNTEQCWKLLVNAARDARYLGIVPADAFRDRRNPPATVFFKAAIVSGVFVDGRMMWSAELSEDIPALPSARFGAVYGPPVLVELWCEKTTVNDVLMPLAQRHGGNLITGAGEMSLTAVRLFLDRARQASTPARILYVSDFDPAGRSMPAAVARKIEFALDGATGLDVQLNPIVLTPAQCASYRLPRSPIKETERRGDLFESRFGAGATELDALEAIHPSALGRIVEREIKRYTPPDARREFDAAVGEHHDYLDRISAAAAGQFAVAIDRLRAEYEAIVDDLSGWRARAEPVYETIAETLGHVELREFVPPESPPPNDPPNPLFDSRRGYLEQLDAYKAWQSGFDDAEAAE